MIKWTTVPKQIQEITEALAGEYPPTNTNLLMKTADYWLKNAGPSHPFFKRTIVWIADMENIKDNIDSYQEFLDCLEAAKTEGESNADSDENRKIPGMGSPVGRN